MSNIYSHVLYQEEYPSYKEKMFLTNAFGDSMKILLYSLLIIEEDQDNHGQSTFIMKLTSLAKESAKSSVVTANNQGTRRTYLQTTHVDPSLWTKA